MSNSKNLLLIFTRNPELGKVKTRLAKGVGAAAALTIYKRLLKHTHKEVQSLSATKRVGYSNRIGEKDLWEDSLFEKFVQKGDDLGIRMETAFNEGFSEGFQKIIIIGSDLYDLRTTHLEEAFKALDTQEAVIGPALDGGYYLLGLRKPIPAIFRNKVWGTETVLEDTKNDLKNTSVYYLESLNDIDHAEDLAIYPEFVPYLNNEAITSKKHLVNQD